MARKAREKSSYATYLISNYSGPVRDIFKSDADREKFLEILCSIKKKFSIKVYYVDISSKDSYTLIIYDNGSDISKVMKSITISYSMYAKCDGKLFKDRYKSELIGSPLELETKMLSLSEVKTDYKFSSLDIIIRDPIDREIEFKVLPGDDIKSCERIIPCSDESQCISSVEEAVVYLGHTGLSPETIKRDKKLRDEKICELRRRSTLSLRDIGNLFGISESSVCKIISKKVVE